MNTAKWLCDVPTYALNKRFDKELRLWTFDMPGRNVWDTFVPEEMVLLARNISEREQFDPVVINELHDELTNAITASGGVQLTPIKHDVIYDIHTREHFYDVWVILKTKGGWHG